MATLTRLHLYPQSSNLYNFKEPFRTCPFVLFRPGFNRSGLRQHGGRYEISFEGCRSFKNENGNDDLEEEGTGIARNCRKLKESEVKLDKRENGFLSSRHNGDAGDFGNAMAKLEEVISPVAVQIGRYILTMMSTGVILAVGFQLSGGDSYLNNLIWYSWLGGIVIGTMIGTNMVLDKHCRAGPRNVVITGSTRGLGKALAREFLLSGDRVVVASRSPESVRTTVKELEENLKEVISTAGDSSTTRSKLARAKVVGISCDVCEPRDVQKLSNFAVSELGSIDIWINNAGTNKGFRPLLQFTDEEVKQIVSTNLVGSILCTREAMSIMRNQVKGGHIFNMDGAGSGGSSTPLTAV